MKNLLFRTNCYELGPMENSNGQVWRAKLEQELAYIEINFFNPYRKPFIQNVKEGDLSRAEMKKWMNEHKYSLVAKRMKTIRSDDLRLCDLSDFGVMEIRPSIPTFGAVEECSQFVRCKKPLFIFVEGGKEKCPLWIMGMVPHEQVYNNLDEIIDKIKKIDVGLVKLDLTRWRLLRKEYR